MKVNEKRVIYARTLIQRGVDLNMNYFAQSYDKLSIIRETCKLFKFRSSNKSRTDAQQFYYSAQKVRNYFK